MNAQGTYTGNDASWLNQLNLAVDAIGIPKLGVGLETVNPSDNNQPFSLEQVRHIPLILARTRERERERAYSTNLARRCNGASRRLWLATFRRSISGAHRSPKNVR